MASPGYPPFSCLANSKECYPSSGFAGAPTRRQSFQDPHPSNSATPRHQYRWRLNTGAYRSSLSSPAIPQSANRRPGKRRSNRLPKGLPGSKPRWCSAPGQQRKRRTATCRRNFTESKLDAVRRRLSWPLLLPSSRPSITCLRTGRCIRTSVANTLTAALLTSKNEAWSNASLTLATPWRSSP